MIPAYDVYARCERFCDQELLNFVLLQLPELSYYTASSKLCLSRSLVAHLYSYTFDGFPDKYPHSPDHGLSHRFSDLIHWRFLYEAVEQIIHNLQCLIDEPFPGKASKKLPLGNMSVK